MGQKHIFFKKPRFMGRTVPGPIISASALFHGDWDLPSVKQKYVRHIMMANFQRENLEEDESFSISEVYEGRYGR
jgi:hypothetical protein